MDAFMKDVLNVKPVLLKQNAPEMDAFQLSAKTFEFSAWNLFFVETWCPQNQCLSCQRCCQHWTFFVWHNAPKMDAFMKDVLNVKPVLLKQNAPEMDAFHLSAKTFEFSAWNLFCWNLMPPKPTPFMSKMLSTLNLFCLTQCPQNGWKMFSMWSQFF